MSLLDVRRLKVLAEVARCGSISAAADALNFTPSAVSQQLRALEREAGVSLLVRTPRSVALTPAAEALVGHTGAVLATLAEAEAEIRAIAALEGGRLRMGAFRSAAEVLLPEAVSFFRHRHPLVRLTLVEDEPEAYVADVRANRLDLVLTFEYDGVPAAPEEGIERAFLFAEPMVVVLPAGHALAGAEAVEMRALADEAWIASTPRSAVQVFTAKACAAAGFAPRLAFETDDYHVAQSLVAGGVGLTFVPRSLARTLHGGVVTRRVTGVPVERRIYAAHRPGGGRAPAVAAMLAVLRELAAEL
jgi:DNA-binding transcriptional LysR family regulator